MSKTSKEVNDGGPAFPRAPFDYIDSDSGLGWSVREQPGMSLRDWFAGQALAGFMASGAQLDCTEAELAGDAYTFANAMLKARSTQGDGT